MLKLFGFLPGVTNSKKSPWTRIQNEWRRFLRKTAKAAHDPGKTIRYEFSRFIQKMVLMGPAELQELLRQHYNSLGMEFCLRQLRDRGYSPRTIIDCGAYIGGWTRMVKKLFPQARVIMIEAQADKRQALAAVAAGFPGAVEFVSCLLGPESKGDVPFFEMETGSSVLQEMTNLPRRPVTLQMRTLDDVLSNKDILDPVFLKLDVQGFEIEVLKGARRTLQRASLVVLEVSLVQVNEKAPVFHEVVQFMKDHGFLAYDMDYASRSAHDQILMQADIFFVPENSPLRRPGPFANNRP